MSCTVAYCGGMDPKDYSVTTQLFPDAKKVDFKNYDKTYEAVVNGECDYAVMPFEASYSGEIPHVMDLMFRGGLYVCRVTGIKNEGETVRYAVLSREDEGEGGDDERGLFMMLFTIKDETGSLAKAISAISDAGFNLRTMRSRPMAGLPWHYYFYAEAVGNDRTDKGQEMLKALASSCESLKVMGRYVKEKLYED